jgi:hypothetical protein
MTKSNKFHATELSHTHVLLLTTSPQKSDPNGVQLTAGGNLIDYPGKLTTRTADLTITKLLWNSVISTKDSRYMCLDIENFYLSTPMARFEYMKIPINVFPPATIKQ